MRDTIILIGFLVVMLLAKKKGARKYGEKTYYLGWGGIFSFIGVMKATASVLAWWWNTGTKYELPFWQDVQPVFPIGLALAIGLFYLAKGLGLFRRQETTPQNQKVPSETVEEAYERLVGRQTREMREAGQKAGRRLPAASSKPGLNRGPILFSLDGGGSKESA